MESLTRGEKEQCWQEMVARVDKITDKLEKPVDEGIKETVIVLNLLGYTTVQSCEGHTERGVSGPWVDIVPGGIETLIQRRHQMIARVVEARKQKQLEEEDIGHVLREIDEAAREPMIQLAEKLLACLTVFYQEHQAPYDSILMFRRLDLGYRLECYGTSLQSGVPALPRHNERLPQYQEEMRAFTTFLKARYFAS